jgi:hypothetical protein
LLKGTNDYDDFINDINGYTLVGENVGDENHAHIKLYSEKDIIFYAMVQNDSEEICLPVNQMKNILSGKYGFNIVSIIQSPKLESIEELSEYMEKVYSDILMKDVDTGGEGGVAYFSAVSSDDHETVVSLAKLKTFEYRFLRKLREKLKSFQKKKTSVSSVVKKIEDELKEILGEDGDELDLRQYLEFATYVFQVAVKSTIQVNYSNLFAFFIKDIKEMYESKAVIDDNKIREIFNKYSIANSKSSDFSFRDNAQNEGEESNSKDQKKNKKDKKNINKKQRLDSNTEEIEIDMGDSNTFERGTVYFFIAFGLVGGGKSTFYNFIEKIILEHFQDKVNLMYISSDIERAKVIDEYLINNPEATRDDAFKKTAGSAKNDFNKKLFVILKGNYSAEKINIFYLDKNYPRMDAVGGLYR